MTWKWSAALAPVLLVAQAASGVEITSCGQVVAAGEVAQLRGDLDCAAQPTWPFSARGVQLGNNATLQMNGFAIRGDGTGVGVVCGVGSARPTCRVLGPGTISGFWAGLNGGGCRFVIRGVLVQGNTNGIFGPLACDLDAEGVNVVENTEDGIWVARMRGRNLVVRDNGGHGLVATRVNVRGLAATGNGREGVLQTRRGPRAGLLASSTVIANAARSAGFDIAAAGHLRLYDVRCGRSAKLEYPPIVDSDDDVPRVIGSFGCLND
jgi:hypothetical protein